MNLVYGGHHHLNILLKFLKKAMGLIRSQDCQKIGIQEAILKRTQTYTSDGNVPKIKGGEFIVGKCLRIHYLFSSLDYPQIASVINFDADLYSSTICALNFSMKKVMDKDTILIFDELIIHESWEQDEFKALNDNLFY